MKTIPITKEMAVAAFGGNQAALARALNIGRANITIWPDGEIIPRVHAQALYYDIRKKHFKNLVLK